MTNKALAPTAKNTTPRELGERFRDLAQRVRAHGGAFLDDHCGESMSIDTLDRAANILAPPPRKPRTLCSLEHDRGVRCPNEPECCWGD